MTIHQRMKEIFEQAEIPGFLQVWKATPEYPKIPEKYCTYIVTTESDALCADDEALITQMNVYIHLYGKTDVTDEYNRLRAAITDQVGLTLLPRVHDLDDIREGEYQYHRRIDTYFYQFN